MHIAETSCLHSFCQPFSDRFAVCCNPCNVLANCFKCLRKRTFGFGGRMCREKCFGILQLFEGPAKGYDAIYHTAHGPLVTLQKLIKLCPIILYELPCYIAIGARGRSEYARHVL